MDQPMDTVWGEELKRRLGVEDAPHVTVNRISPSLLAKCMSASERASMELVRQHTTIPVPRDLCPHLVFLVMDLIDGEMLYECWDRLSRFKQFRIACTLRWYTKQLHSLTRPAPGSLGDGCVRGVVFSDAEYGPFATARSFRRFCELVAFFGWRAKALMAIAANKEIPPLPRPDLIDWTLPSFVHGDLNISNVLLDRQGSLWVVDWANAGYYPSTMEPIAMRRVDEIMHARDVSSSWRSYRSFIAGTV
uniref:MFS domain-containing protein n=1 Tax=Ganoderma boninense TaxID=34458 RepID=A0A5K1K8T9_9APHY|nr:MFS domain-containing protein [Ganoderma boninense]